jgi:trans-2,3-dihydro-3-hydroxyanthranilate isomerase
LPTTGFVAIPEDDRGRTADIRFFTPDREIDACGHVTVAVATALLERGIWEEGSEVTVRARGGTFALQLEASAIAITHRLRLLQLEPLGWDDVAAVLGPLTPHADLPLAIASTGLRHLVVPVADTTQLGAIKLDAARISALANGVGVDTICVWAPTSDANRVRVRDLCAAIGALEEPASGTTSAALALYLARNDALAQPDLVVEQGIEMGRPSRLDVCVETLDKATIRGSAEKLLRGDLHLLAFAPTVAPS